MNRRNWKTVQPNNLREAFRLCKDYAREKKNLSVGRIADLMGISEDLLYKWMSDAKMPATSIASFEMICGVNFVTRFLCGLSNLIPIAFPKGKFSEKDLTYFVELTGAATKELSNFYQTGASLEETLAAINNLLNATAYHRENVKTYKTPELDL